MDDDKIRSITGGATPNETAEALRRLRAEMPHMAERLEMMAQVTWIKFQALKKAGFNEVQALQLCCASPY